MARVSNPRKRVAQGQLLCACSPCYGDGLIAEGEYYWQYVGDYTVPFNICGHAATWSKGARPMPADGFCHECRDRPGERFTVAKVIGAVDGPSPRRLWVASYLPTGKPCALTLAQAKNEGR